jgi:small subunit ribosomal protein S2
MENDQTKEKDSIIKELFKIGAHFGFSRARRHPSANSYIYGYKNKTAIIDLEKSLDSLEKASEFVKKVAAEGKQMLFVGSKNEVRDIIKQVADSIDMPYVTERWIGGTFTNFKQIRSRVQTLVNFKDKQVKGELSVYTKKERGVIGKQVEKLEKFFGSIVGMEKTPGAVFLVDVKEESIAFEEATLLNIPVISLSSSDCDIRRVAYPIVANDSSRETVKYFATKIAQAYSEGKKMAQTLAKEKAEAQAVKTGE